MRATAAIAILLAAALTIATAATAKTRSPRLEQLAINAADTLTAKNAAIRLADLVSGWKGGPSKPDDTSPPDCKWQDFSAYTITGESEADYSLGASVVSSVVEMYATPAQATGDFKLGTRTGTAACEGAVIAHALSKTAKLVSAKMVAMPNLGDRAVVFEFVVKVGVNTFYADLIAFVRDRALGALFTLNPGAPIGGRQTLARLMDQKLSPKGAA
jgi:hypothetical protein